MIYFSVDLETTGLNPDSCQILEVGIVVENTKNPRPLEELPSISVLIDNVPIVGEPFALHMNASLLHRIAKGEGLRLDQADKRLVDFIHQHRSVVAADKDNYAVAAGKNIAGFDLRFLSDYLPGVAGCFHRRAIDPTALFLRHSDILAPSLSECLKRAGMEPTVTHSAVDDAKQVIALIRASGVFDRNQ